MLEIDLLRSCPINRVQNMFERRFERKGLINPNPICKTQTRTTTYATINHNWRNKMPRKRAEIIGIVCFKENKQFIEYSATGTSRHNPQNNLNRKWTEHNVSVWWCFQEKMVCEYERDISLVCDRVLSKSWESGFFAITINQTLLLHDVIH